MTPQPRPSNAGRFTILTAPGPGAVAVIELACESAETARFILRRMSSSDRSMTIGRICYGRWNDEDLVVVRTSARTWEIQCHGGTVAVDRICSDLITDGAQEMTVQDDGTPPGGRNADTVVGRGVTKGAWDQQNSQSVRHELHRKIQGRLQNARSRKTAGLILAQETTSLYVDLNIIGNATVKDSPDVTAIQRRLTRWQDVADHLTEPWSVVFAGAPNVGKSSLMNAIAGIERSIVCDQPGTTRDVVEVDTIIEGWPFRFYDTAGLREGSADPIEELGIRQSHLAAAHCDVLCLIFDDDSGISASHHQLPLAKLSLRTVLVRNKSDLRTGGNSDSAPGRESSMLSHLPIINVSAHTGQGLPELLHWIKQAVVPQEPTKETALPL